jgi:hypothetical protein
MDKEAIAAQSLAAYISKHEIVKPMPRSFAESPPSQASL